MRVDLENRLALVLRDAHPVTPGHRLIVPRRHVADLFQLHQPEINAIWDLLGECRSEILTEDPTIDGFNVGVNSGRVAGQTIFHVHVHLIPRRADDVPDPRGGVRGVIPEKQRY
jgi:diadenosine tetraphosphate (Ap4A) HIT family hydrolase